jgi:hypothetical protein
MGVGGLIVSSHCAIFIAESEGRVAGFVAGACRRRASLAEPLRALGYGAQLLFALGAVEVGEIHWAGSARSDFVARVRADASDHRKVLD